jgi:ribonuclease BN (tRNA processing enzyme)
MNQRLPFRFIEPTFFAGLLDDPLLLLNARPLGKSLLFDCGQLHHLAKRVLKSINAIFISHCHMDHFMGIDTFIRHNHVSPKTIDIFGPPGIAAKMASKLASYDWNLTEPPPPFSPEPKGFPVAWRVKSSAAMQPSTAMPGSRSMPACATTRYRHSSSAPRNGNLFPWTKESSGVWGW